MIFYVAGKVKLFQCGKCINDYFKSFSNFNVANRLLTYMLHKEIQVEQQLFRLVAAGDAVAYKEVFDRYCDKLTAFIYRLTKSEDTAAELTQDVFVKLWINRSRLSDVDNPQAYIFTMASNRTMDHLRKVSAHHKMLTALWHRISGAQQRTEDSYYAKEYNELINQAIIQLSPQKQKIFRLSRYEGLKHEEIAAHLSLSKSTVKNHLVETLRHIKTYLHQHSETVLVIVFAWWF